MGSPSQWSNSGSRPPSFRRRANRFSASDALLAAATRLRRFVCLARLGSAAPAQSRPAPLRRYLCDLLGQLAFDARDVQRLEHVTELLVFLHHVTEPGVEAGHQLQ